MPQTTIDPVRRDQEFFRRLLEVGVFTHDEVQAMKQIGSGVVRKLLGIGVEGVETLEAREPAPESLPVPPVVADVDPAEVAKLVGMALSQPLDSLTMRSPNGRQFSLYIDDNGRAKVSPVTT